MLQLARMPGNLSFRREPEVHPERHVDENDLGGAIYTGGNRISVPETIDDPILAGYDLLVLFGINVHRGRDPALPPKELVDFEMDKSALFAHLAGKRGLSAPCISQKDDTRHHLNNLSIRL